MMLLSGGLASHAAIIVRDESNIAWVYDAQDNSHFKNGEQGIKRTRLSEWLDFARNAGYDLAWLPLDPAMKYKKSWDPKKLVTFFESVEHSAYSFVQEFMAAIDTADEAYPAPFNAEYVPSMMRAFIDWSPYDDFNNEFMESLNKRFSKAANIQKSQLPKTFEDLVVYTAIDANKRL